MKLNQEELWDLVRCSEWLYNPDYPKTDEINAIGIKLHNKLKKFYQEHNEQEFKLEPKK